MELATIIVSAVITGVIAVIGFFLKRTINRVDESDSKISEIREDYTPKKVHQKDFDECRADIKSIKDDYITKEDFYREQSKTERKLDIIDGKIEKKFDKVMDILLEMRGEHSDDK